MRMAKNSGNRKESVDEVFKEDLQQDLGARYRYKRVETLKGFEEYTNLCKWSRFSNTGLSSGCEQDSQEWTWGQHTGCSRLNSVYAGG